MGSRTVITFAIAIVGALVMPGFASAQSRSTLPSAETEGAIQSLRVEPPARPRNRGGSTAQPEFRDLQVDPSRSRLLLEKS